MVLGRGIMRVFGESLLIIGCLLHLLDQGTGQSDTCKLDKCCKCFSNASQNWTNGTGQSDTCKPDKCCNCFSNASQNWTNGVQENCTMKAFNVTINISSSLPLEEGSNVILKCVHDLPNGSYSWMKDNVLQEEKSDTFEIKIILKTAVVLCKVDSNCGVFNSNITVEVNAANNMVIILVCVGVAAALLMMFAIGMKISLRRGQVQSQARKRQRQQNMENIHSTVNTTVTSYY